VPSWQLQAHRLRAVLDGYLIASGVTLRVKDVPVAYLPWFAYPLQNRQSGLLIPSFGLTSSQGFHYVQPLYWAIGRSQDATFSLDLRSSIGIGLDSEYRYQLSETGHGLANISYFYDWDIGVNFLAYHFDHHQRWLDDRLQLKWDVNLVNRKDFFTQLSFSAFNRSLVGLESLASLTYRLDQQFFYLKVAYTQSLVTSNQQSVQRLPEIGYRLVDAKLGPLPFYAGLQATFVHFYEGTGLGINDPTGDHELRFDLFPTLTGRVEPIAGVVVTPTVGVRETYYQSHSLIPDGSVAREAVYAALRAETQLVRMYGAVTHLVEPALLYEYAHQLDDAVVPQFDEVDTIPEKRHVTLMLTNRLQRAGTPSPPAGPASIAAAEGSGRGDLLWVKLTESYALRGSDGDPFTDLRVQLQAQPTSLVVVRGEGFVNFYGQGITVMNSQLRARPTDWLVFTLGEHYTRPGVVPKRGDLFSAETAIFPDPIGGTQRIEAINWGGQVNLPWRMALAGKVQYDFEHDNFTELTGAVRWRGPCNECWTATLGYQQLIGQHQILFLVTLRGLSSADPEIFKELFFE